jgi:hypothetical protein
MKPRDWPNNAKQARDESIAQATIGLRALSPLLTEHYTQEEIYRRIALAMHSLHEIKTLLSQLERKN